MSTTTLPSPLIEAKWQEVGGLFDSRLVELLAENINVNLERTFSAPEEDIEVWRFNSGKSSICPEVGTSIRCPAYDVTRIDLVVEA